MGFTAKDTCIVYKTSHVSLQTKLKTLQENPHFLQFQIKKL